jgi:PhnB protein
VASPFDVDIHLEGESTAEAGRLFNGLAEGGRVEMPLQRTEWSQDYGICIDRFGVQWMVDHTGEVRMTPGQPE